MVDPDLVRSVLEQYRLPRWGTHGVAHWARVLENGLVLAASTGAKVEVVRPFALLHDSQRTHNAYDTVHGPTAAAYADALRLRFFELNDDDYGELREAIALHTTGKRPRTVTIASCWDADRLDLGRLKIRPDPRRLCTDFARTSRSIDWAYERGLSGYVPLFAITAKTLEKRWGTVQAPKGCP